jgi:predicted RNA-binding Zn ribbon-like protein
MYDFGSGDLSLDFANTVDWHGSERPVETLVGFADLVAWGEQAGLVSAEFAKYLLQMQVKTPQETDRSYKAAIQLREALYRIFSHLYAGEPVLEADLELLNHVVRQAMSHLELASLDGTMQWIWSPDLDDINRILWPVARAAALLLTSDRVSLVRECEDDRGCGSLFIDQTKNHSRRWCSMESCGNRAKARRHYSRVKAK